MSSDDGFKLPRATLRDEKLYIEGQKEPYFRDRKNKVRLRIDALMISRGYQDYRNRTGKVLTESLHGIATPEEDEFAVIGLKIDDKTPIKFVLKPISEEDQDLDWRASIGFIAHDWELGWEECFWVEAYCASQYFDDLLAAVRRGYVENIRLGMETTMWTRDPPLMSGSPRTWHLAPPIDGKPAHDPTLEGGYISSLFWEEKFDLHSPKEAKGKVTEVKPQVPQVVELPARVYSMLTALLAIAAALLVLTFLRH